MHTIKLSYFKQGDDFDTCLESIKNKENDRKYAEALRKQAAMLRDDAEKLERVANLIELTDNGQGQVDVRGNVHQIDIIGPNNMLKILKGQHLI